MASFEDVNGDGYQDMVVHVLTQELGLDPGATSALLSGYTYAGAPYYGARFEGSDSILIVK